MLRRIAYDVYININSIIIFCYTGKSIWQLVLEQFDDLLVKILLLAAIISFVSITNENSCLLDYTERFSLIYLRISGPSFI